MEQDEKQTAVAELLEDFSEEHLWACIVAFQGRAADHVRASVFLHIKGRENMAALQRNSGWTGGRTASPSPGAQSGWRSRMC